jgi:hypothetical protein
VDALLSFTAYLDGIIRRDIDASVPSWKSTARGTEGRRHFSKDATLSFDVDEAIDVDGFVTVPLYSGRTAGRLLRRADMEVL